MALPVCFPGIAMFCLEKLKMAPKNKALSTLVGLGFITIQLTFAVPVSMALYP